MDFLFEDITKINICPLLYGKEITSSKEDHLIISSLLRKHMLRYIFCKLQGEYIHPRTLLDIWDREIRKEGLASLMGRRQKLLSRAGRALLGFHKVWAGKKDITGTMIPYRINLGEDIDLVGSFDIVVEGRKLFTIVTDNDYSSDILTNKAWIDSIAWKTPHQYTIYLYGTYRGSRIHPDRDRKEILYSYLNNFRNQLLTGTRIGRMTRFCKICDQCGGKYADLKEC